MATEGEAAKDTLPYVVRRGHVLLSGASVLICIGFLLWAILSWTNHAGKYAQAMEGWRIGGRHLVELTLVGEDRERLACASDGHFAEVRCGFGADRTPRATADDHVLSPFNTVGGKTILAAGLWSSPALAKLPRRRFTVVCNFHVLGVMKNVTLRWQKQGGFDRVRQGLPAGKLEACAIPQ